MPTRQYRLSLNKTLLSPEIETERSKVIDLVSHLRGAHGTELVEEKRYRLKDNGRHIAQRPYHKWEAPAVVPFEESAKEVTVDKIAMAAAAAVGPFFC